MWCPSLGLCSNGGADRNRRRWNDELCYLSHRAFKNHADCPVELVQSTRRFYRQTIQASKIIGPPALWSKKARPHITATTCVGFPLQVVPNGRAHFAIRDVPDPSVFDSRRNGSELGASDLPFPFIFFGKTFHQIHTSHVGEESTLFALPSL